MYNSIIEISVSKIEPELIAKVAQKTNRSIVEVSNYLNSKEQDNELLKAFLFFGVGPINKSFQVHEEIKKESENVSMGAMVGTTFCPLCKI